MTELLSLRAWFANRRAGDLDAEQAHLEEILDRNPGPWRPSESLAELLLRLGQPERAKQLRMQRGKLERTLDWYMVNIFPADRLEHATELARAAEAVGRRFEAHCWWELAAVQSAHDALARVEVARLDREAMSRPPQTPQLTPEGLPRRAEGGGDP